MKSVLPLGRWGARVGRICSPRGGSEGEPAIGVRPRGGRAGGRPPRKPLTAAAPVGAVEGRRLLAGPGGTGRLPPAGEAGGRGGRGRSGPNPATTPASRATSRRPRAEVSPPSLLRPAPPAGLAARPWLPWFRSGVPRRRAGQAGHERPAGGGCRPRPQGLRLAPQTLELPALPGGAGARAPVRGGGGALRRAGRRGPGRPDLPSRCATRSPRRRRTGVRAPAGAGAAAFCGDPGCFYNGGGRGRFPVGPE